jgi:hypothetical protein
VLPRSGQKPVHANKHFVKLFIYKAEKFLKKDAESPENCENSRDLRESCISLRGSAAFKVRAEILKLEQLCAGNASPSPTDSKLDLSDDLSLPLMSEEGEDHLCDNFI